MTVPGLLALRPLVASDITVGVHPQAKWGPLTVNVDIVWATVIAGLIVITFGLVLRAKATSGVPSAHIMSLPWCRWNPPEYRGAPKLSVK